MAIINNLITAGIVILVVILVLAILKKGKVGRRGSDTLLVLGLIFLVVGLLVGTTALWVIGLILIVVRVID